MGSRYVGLGYQTKRTFLGKLAVNSLLAGAAVVFSFSALADDVVPKRETRTDVLLPGRGVPGVVVANGQKIFSEGKGDVPACMTCHGAGGGGLEAMGAPRLAGIGFP